MKSRGWPFGGERVVLKISRGADIHDSPEHRAIAPRMVRREPRCGSAKLRDTTTASSAAARRTACKSRKR